jgi:hypothetical protein
MPAARLTVARSEHPTTFTRLTHIEIQHRFSGRITFITAHSVGWFKRLFKTDGVGTPSDQSALLHSNILTEENPRPVESLGEDEASGVHGRKFWQMPPKSSNPSHAFLCLIHSFEMLSRKSN